MREGKISAQTQSGIAFTGDDESWFLINASPDLANQIESSPALRPHASQQRGTPIAGVFLTNGDLDHTLGLLLMRNGESPLAIYASDETRAALSWIDVLLKPFREIHWHPVARPQLDGLKPSSLSADVLLNRAPGIRAIELQKSVAFELQDRISGKTALVAPAVSELTGELRAAIDRADVVLFDGTFWSDDELNTFRPGARTARMMNHLPINDGSLDFLRASTARRKIYTHINNTNPILMPGSAERRQVEQAGIEIGHDGLEIVL